jgi:hypothetical protein
MGSCAYLSAQLGDLAAAQVVYDLLSPYAEQIVVTGCIFAGAVAHYLGMLATTLGRFDDAGGHFRAAETTHTRIGAPTWLAQTRLESARLLLAGGRPGDDERARELLGQALVTARELGLENVERRAVALL